MPYDQTAVAQLSRTIHYTKSVALACWWAALGVVPAACRRCFATLHEKRSSCVLVGSLGRGASGMQEVFCCAEESNWANSVLMEPRQREGACIPSRSHQHTHRLCYMPKILMLPNALDRNRVLLSTAWLVSRYFKQCTFVSIDISATAPL